MPSFQPNSAPPLFVGEFSHALDGKSRVTIPSAWRYEEEAEFFLMPSTKGDCLKALTRLELDRIRAKAAEMQDGPQRLEVLRALGSGARQCRLDKAGRLIVPEEFCKGLNLSGDVSLVGAFDTFEIWNSAARENAKSRTSMIATPHLAQFGL